MKGLIILSVNTEEIKESANLIDRDVNELGVREALTWTPLSVQVWTLLEGRGRHRGQSE